jgi:hypothetical protein
MAQGFNSSPQTGAAGKQDLSEADIEGFVQAIFGNSAEPFFVRPWHARTAVSARGSSRAHAPETVLTSA